MNAVKPTGRAPLPFPKDKSKYCNVHKGTCERQGGATEKKTRGWDGRCAPALIVISRYNLFEFQMLHSSVLKLA